MRSLGVHTPELIADSSKYLAQKQIRPGGSQNDDARSHKPLSMSEIRRRANRVDSEF
jgi:hypothetical protein